MRHILLFIVAVLGLYAADESLLTGQWNSMTHSLNSGTKTTEKEYFKLNANHTFGIVFLVSVQKGNAYVKDLRIEGTGIWKTRGNILVVVVRDVKVPVAKEVYGISQSSLQSIASSFHSRFVNDPVRILVVKRLSRSELITENESGQTVQYRRQPY